MLPVSPPEPQSLPLPIHPRDLRFAGWICIITITISGAVFGAAGGLVNLNAMLPGWFTGTSLTFSILGAFFFALFCFVTYGASFFLSGIVCVLLSFFLLHLASLAVRVRLPVAKRLITVTAAAAGFIAAVFAVGAWQPIGVNTWVAACLSATAAGITTWLKAMPMESISNPLHAQTLTPDPHPANLGRSTWNDLD